MDSSQVPDASFQKNFSDAKKTFDGALVVIVVLSVVGTAAFVWIVYAVIKCVRKNGLPPVNIGVVTSPQAAGAAVSPLPPLETRVDMATIEKFFEDQAKERPLRFSPQDLAGFTRNYSAMLGSGGFGVVYRGEFPNGVQVAVKVLKSDMGKSGEEQFMAEIGSIGRTYHINLVRLYGFCFDPDMKALVYEYMENGSLDALIFGRRSNMLLSVQKLHEIAVGTAKGIAYLHEECHQRIIHYDIKPGNVLLDAAFLPKVADFGLAKLCDRAATHLSMSRVGGTPGYAAPEIYMPLPLTHKCDVYSFVMLLFEVVGRRRNYAGEQPESQGRWLPQWAWMKLEAGLLEDALSRQLGVEEEGREKAARMAKVAMWCVQYLPADRPEMSKVVKMLEGELEIPAPPNPFGHLAADDVELSLGSLLDVPDVGGGNVPGSTVPAGRSAANFYRTA